MSVHSLAQSPGMRSGELVTAVYIGLTQTNMTASPVLSDGEALGKGHTGLYVPTALMK